MKVAWSVAIGDARGRLGFICATKNRFGPSIGRALRTLRRHTPGQLHMRASLAYLSQLWTSSAMALYRGDWCALALGHAEKNVFDADIFKTGLQWFIRANLNRQTIAESPILDDPAWAAVGDPGTVTVTHVAGPPEKMDVSATTPPTANEAVVILATRPISPGIGTTSHQQRFIQKVNPGTAGPWDILAAYTAKLGAPLTNRQIFVDVHYVYISQGRAGESAQAHVFW